MTNKERVLRAIKRKGESKEFYNYCENMLHYFDFLGLPALRDMYKHHATPSEVRGHLERVSRTKNRMKEKFGNSN